MIELALQTCDRKKYIKEGNMGLNQLGLPHCFLMTLHTLNGASYCARIDPKTIQDITSIIIMIW